MLLVGLSIILFFVAVVGFMVGPVFISPGVVLKILASQIPKLGDGIVQTWPNTYNTIVLDVRLPRVIVGMLVGIGLSVAGCGMQGLFRNPMASPYVSGISSGGAFGAALAVNIGAIYYLVPLFAFVFSSATVFLVYTISRVRGKVSMETLLLSGIAVASFFSALVSLMMYLSAEKLESIVFWMMGGFWASGWDEVIILLPFLVLCIPIYVFLSRDLNALLLGEQDAQDLGINVEATKRFILVLTALLVGACVAVSGTIGFVGLIIPHITRIIVGPDHKVLIPACIFTGGIFMILTDIIARMIIQPSELPVGIITSLFGVPFFLYLLRRRKTSMGW
ncbi:MAG: iron chelate uptake ABC transporter family permease subunit [Candidatus Methanofastidiosa archaeon]|nr:iron chelate uptake ABC transporter family permease subunit [Candidatus Methanofastidiosa archaeon]